MADRQLQNKVAWVTGSSRGIGRVIAEHLASLGARVAIHGTTPFSTRAFNEGESLEAVAKQMSAAQGVDVLPVSGDLTDEAVVEQIVADIHRAFGRIDILVCCAGGDISAEGVMSPTLGKAEGNDPVNISVPDLRAILDRNLMTCILACRAVAPEMMARRSGWIVNIGSDAGLAGREGGAIYATAKAAVHEYTRCLAAMLMKYNVYANAVVPGPIVTQRFLATRAIDESQMVTEGTLERYGWPIEIARAVAFLVSSDSSYITGQVLRVNGGRQLFPG